MKVAKRIRVNARLPDHDGKFRDEITQEFTIEFDELEAQTEQAFNDLVDLVNDKMDSQLGDILEKIKELGGRDYTEKK